MADGTADAMEVSDHALEVGAVVLDLGLQLPIVFDIEPPPIAAGVRDTAARDPGQRYRPVLPGARRVIFARASAEGSATVLQ